MPKPRRAVKQDCSSSGPWANIGRILFLMFMLTAGLVLVSTLFGHRANPFLSRSGSPWTLVVLLLTAIPVGIFACSGTLKQFSSWRGCFSKESGFFLLFFLTGCFFNLLTYIPGLNYSLTPNDLNRAPFVFAMALGALAVPLVWGVALECVSAWRKRCFLKYAMILFLPPFLYGSVSYFLADSYAWHVHHYMLGLWGVFCFRDDSFYSRMLQALCLGVYVDGIALWGFHAGWVHV